MKIIPLHITLTFLFAIVCNIANAQKTRTLLQPPALIGTMDSMPGIVGQKVVAKLNKKKGEYRQQFNQIFKEANSITSTSLIEIDSSAINGGGSYSQNMAPGSSLILSNSLLVSGDIKGIPLLAEIRYNKFPDYGNILSIGNGFKMNFSFDHKKYIDEKKQLLQQTLDSAHQDLFLDSAVIRYKNVILNSRSVVQAQYAAFIKQNLKRFSEYSGIFGSDSLNLGLIKNHLQSSAYKSHYDNLVASLSASVDTAQKERIASAKTFLDSVQTLVDKAAVLYQKIEELSEYVSTIKRDIIDKISTPGSEKQAITELLNVNGFEKLLMKLNDLQLGTLGPTEDMILGMPPLSFSGLRTGFDNGGRFGKLEIGKVRAENSSLYNFNNALSRMAPDSLPALKQKYFKLTYGIGSEDGDFVRFSLGGITSSRADINSSYMLSIGGRMQLFKNVKIQSDLTRNVSIDSEEKSIGVISKTIWQNIIPESMNELAVSVRLEGVNDKNDLDWSAGYQYIPSVFPQVGGFATVSGRSNYFVSFKKLYLNDRLSVNVRYSKRHSFNGMYGNSTSQSDLGRAQIRYKFKSGQFLLFHFSPNSSTYNSALKDTSLSQRLNGQSYGFSFFAKKRLNGLLLNINGSSDLFKNRFISAGTSTNQNALRTMPFSTFGYQVSIDIVNQKGPTYFCRVYQLFPIHKGNDAFFNTGKQLRVEGGLNLSHAKSFSAEMGLSLCRSDSNKPGGGFVGSIRYFSERMNLFLSANYDLIKVQRDANIVGFGNRVELGYNIKLFTR